MTLTRTLFFGSSLLALGVLAQAVISGVRSYHLACLAVDRALLEAGDGPWVRLDTRIVLNISTIGSRGALPPHWMFRLENPKSGAQSKRAFVGMSGDRVFVYNQFSELGDSGGRFVQVSY